MGVKGYVPSPCASVPHENVPPAPAFTSQFAAFSPETMRFVVLAVVAVMAVVEAYGKILAVDEVAR